MAWFSSKKDSKSSAGASSKQAVAAGSNGSYVAPTVAAASTAVSSKIASASTLSSPPSPMRFGEASGAATIASAPAAAPAVTSQQQQQQPIVNNINRYEAAGSDNKDNNDVDDDDDYEEVESPPSASYSGAGESDPERQYGEEKGSKQTHLNSLFNGHLMKWKYEAEEGTSFLRVPAFFGALALMVTAIVAVIIYPAAWEPRSIVMTTCVVVMSLFILVLEGRFVAPNPVNTRAHVRNVMTRNFNILRFVWGRGILYIIVGTINVAQTWIITMASGGFMILLGIISIFVGVHASRKFAALRNSLADESYLLLLFSYYDSDSDGYLDANQFTNLLSYLGMEVDDRYALKAFNAIDRNGDRRIAFDEFNHWWTSGYIERGRKGPVEYEDDSRVT